MLELYVGTAKFCIRIFKGVNTSNRNNFHEVTVSTILITDV